MKKILFTSYNLGIGGIEKALVNLLSEFDYNKYQIDLILQDKNVFYNIDKNINIKYYKVIKSGNIIVRKIINRLKIILTCILNYHKYNASICYATYDIPSSIITRYASKNNILWVHSDYLLLYKNDIKKTKNFFNKLKTNKFKHIVFVSDEAKNNFIKIYPNLKEKTIVINNLINYKEIEEKMVTKEKLFNKKNNLVYVGRLEEESKCLSRLFKTMKMIKENNKDIHLWLIGDGPDKNKYEQIIEEYDIKNYVTMLGKKNNPYPYIKQSDAIILVSNYEGFPVVYLEALTLNKNIITTIDVTSGSLHIKDYAQICKKDSEDIYNNIVSYFEKKLKVKKFNINEYNKENIKKIEDIIGGKND